MKLYDIPEKSKIFCKCSDGSKFITYDHPDGMYSYCVTEKGAIVHLSMSAPLEEVEGGYKIKNNE